MKKFTIAAAALVAATGAAALSGCAATDAAAEAPLAITGEAYELGTYLPGAHSVRTSLVEQHLAGADVSADLAAICLELAGLEGVTGDYAEQWILFCESPDYAWDALTDTWVPAEEAPNLG